MGREGLIKKLVDGLQVDVHQGAPEGGGGKGVKTRGGGAAATTGTSGFLGVFAFASNSQ
jgi:hypothetical protein